MNGYTLHLGDCRAVMAAMEPGSVDAVVTDPPYLGLAGGLELRGNGVAPLAAQSFSIGDKWGANLDWCAEAWRVCKYGALVFTSHHAIDKVKQAFPEYSSVGLVVWYKRNSPPPQRNVPHFNSEFCWLFKKAPGLIWRNLDTFYDIPLLQAGVFASERVLSDVGLSAAHPTQKPVALMRQLLSATLPGMTVFDPFAGTGTTGVACMQLGRRFIGCEIDPGYFEIAEKRIRQAAAQPPLFAVEPQPKPTQTKFTG